VNDEVKGYDRGRSFRLVLVEGPRVRGTFAVLKPSHGDAWVTAHDVTVYHDEDRRSGRVLYSNDLTGSVTDGVAELSEHMVAENKLADVQEVWDEMLRALVVAVESAKWAGASDD
jgi:hypothetical protein